MRALSAPRCPNDPLALDRAQQAALMACDLEAPSTPCMVDLKWGFFFDGTNNNLERDRPTQSHSNVARLYDIFEIDPRKPELMARYAAGVGTPFEDEVGDKGRGIQQKAGLAAGWGGEARICWALLKLCDNLNYFYESVDLGEALGESDPATVRKMAADIVIPAMQLRQISGDETEMLRQVGTVSSLQSLTATALNTPNHAGRRTTLLLRRKMLEERVTRWRAAKSKPRVRSIRLSVFGFSRGAAEARVFCSWLKDALGGEGGGLSLCGIPVQVDLLGIFDTVASVGMAKSSMVFDGHSGYADEDDLRIPAYVRRCVHLVSAHEVRGSFPLDTAYGVNGDEVVYPGVHSDVGGGYAVGDQGKGFVGGVKQDSAKLSQIPLCHMYREAMAAGVPLNLGAPRVSKEAVAAFKVAPSLIADFNGYVDASQSIKGRDTAALMQAHYGLYLRWRRLRLGAHPPHGMTHQPFIERARAIKTQDVADLLSANLELQEEEAGLRADEADSAFREDGWIAQSLRMAFKPLGLREPVVRAIWGEKMEHWRQVKPHWDNPTPLDPRVVKLFDDYVHDSRAWFKPFGAASEEAWIREQRERMAKLEKRDQAYQAWRKEVDPILAKLREEAKKGRVVRAPMLPPMPPPVTGEDLAELEAYRNNPNSLPLEVSGREPHGLFGYLRWRTTFVEEKSWLQRGVAAAADYKDEKVEDLKRVGDRAIDKVGDAAGNLIEDGVEAGKRYLIDKAKDMLPTGLPRL